MSASLLRRGRAFFALALLLVPAAACSILLNTSGDQCSSDDDCKNLSATAICRSGVCVDSVADADGGSRADGAFVDATTKDSALDVTDAGVVTGFDGCFPGTPKTPDEIQNACTSADCVVFDNCKMLGLCDDAGLPDGSAPEAGAAATTDAGANPAMAYCSDPALRPNVVYVTGSTNLPTFLSAVAPLLAANNPAYTIVWQATSSCTGVDSQFNPDVSKHAIKDALGKQTFYYDANGVAVPCWLGDPVNNPMTLGVPVPYGQATVDVGESDIFSASCATKLKYMPDPSVNGIGEYLGPIQAMTFLVPGASTQQAVSAQAAHLVYGLGGVGDAGTSPWTDPTYFFNRSESTGTNQILSRAISVTPSDWWGTQMASASAMAAQLQAVPAGATEKAIGTLSADVADQNRGNLKELAFQAIGQRCGFWPDSTRFSKDKRNVRDGHYPLWGPLHFFTTLSGGAPTPAAGALVLRFGLPKLDPSLVKAIALSGNIPQCAMDVKRDIEMGPLRNEGPAYGCHCYFDSLVNGSSSCSTCNASTDCKDSAHPTCNYGFCESGN